MSNNRNINTILLVLIFIVLSVGVFVLIDNKKFKNVDSTEEMKKEISEINPELKNPVVAETIINNSDSNVWVKSEKFGLYYQKELNIIEYYENKNHIVEPDSKDSFPVFTATFGSNQDSVITWGGYNPNKSSVCKQDDFGEFKYGVSDGACLNGYRTWVAHFSARAVITKEDLKIFGDFVVKNQVKN